MNCSDVRASLPDLLHGRLEPAAAARAEEHLAGCPACRAEWQALRHVCRLLDLPAAPTVRVDLPALYRRAAEEQALQARRWRRTALAACGLAAVVAAVAVGLRLEVRLEAHQVVVRWSAPPPGVAPPAPALPGPVVPVLPASAEDLRLPRDLIHALADDVDARDRRQQEELLGVQARLLDVQRQANRRLSEIERHLAVLRAAQLLHSLKGEGNERTQVPGDGPGLAQHGGTGAGPTGGRRLAAQP
jgi:anti-sigma factor RsiW